MLNYCEYRHPMHICKAANDQENCFYWQEGKHYKKCMYLRFEKFCDCLEAQMDLDYNPLEGKD